MLKQSAGMNADKPPTRPRHPGGGGRPTIDHYRAGMLDERRRILEILNAWKVKCPVAFLWIIETLLIQVEGRVIDDKQERRDDN